MAKKRATKAAKSKRVKKAAKPARRKAKTRSRTSKSTPKRVVKKKVARKKPAAKARTSSSGSASRKSSPATVDSRLKKVDKELVQLLKQRAELTVRQLESRQQGKQDLFDPVAEFELFQRLDAMNAGPLSVAAVHAVFREVISAARARIKTVRVVYLGPPFSFTHLAAIERFGHGADLIPVNTIASVFEEVNRGHADHGIVPIENSTDGRIVDTLDMFTRLPLRICGEVQMSVHHNLMSRSPRSEIVEVYSKPQALSQCRDWLARNMPRANLHEVTSTSTAAQLARDKPGAAAIASRQAAVQYDLEIVAERIEDNIHNVTRFAIIGDEPTKPTGHDRTALLLQIPHSPGSLSEALTAFKRGKINLTWIESFPLRGPEMGYLFFLDFEGHQREPRIKKALGDLARKAVRMEVLGSYPRSEPVD